jgi:hypothetical protein
MSFIAMLNRESVSAKSLANMYRMNEREKVTYVEKRVADRLWSYVSREMDIMPLQMQDTYEELYRVYHYHLKMKKTFEPKPCKCSSEDLFQKGCQCGGT